MTEIADEIRQHWEALQASNAERLAEIEKYGKESAETKNKVDAINLQITALQERLDTNLTAMENRLNRPQLGGGGGQGAVTDQQRRAYASWWGTVYGQAVAPEDIDLEKIQTYNRAWRDYLRYGNRGQTVQNLMQEGSDPDGGYWVSPDETGRMVSLIYETSPMRQYASAQTISGDALEGTLDLDQAGTGGWVSELGARSDTTTPTIGGWKIELQEQYAMPSATQRLLDDASVDLESWLTNKVSDRFSRDENYAFVLGDGIGKPRGFMTYPAGTPSSTTWAVIEQVNSTVSAGVDYAGFSNIILALKDAYLGNARFFMPRSIEALFRLVVDGNGRPLWMPDIERRGSALIGGFPIVHFQDMAAAGADSLSYAFGDMRAAYQIVDKGGTRVLRDPYTTKGRVKFYSTKRVGGDVVNFEALKIGKLAV